MEDEPKNELSEIVVEKVGLVPQGANRQKFFLLKERKDDPNMADEITIKELPETGPGYWQKMAEMFKQFIVQPETKPTPPPDEKPAVDVEKLLKGQIEDLTALFKAENEKLEKRVVEAEAKVKVAEERALKAEQYASGQTEQAEKQAALQKAMSFKAIPAAPVELADLLLKAEKGMGEDYQKLETLLKTLDKQAWTAGLFSEFGSTRTPDQAKFEDRLAKAAKEKGGYAQALLDLPLEEQAALLKEWEGK